MESGAHTKNYALFPQRLGHTRETLRTVRQRVSQQEDGSSCGLYVFELCRAICNNAKFDFDQFGVMEVDVDGTRDRLRGLMEEEEQTQKKKQKVDQTDVSE
jgi:hypothetical protein